VKKNVQYVWINLINSAAAFAFNFRVRAGALEIERLAIFITRQQSVNVYETWAFGELKLLQKNLDEELKNFNVYFTLRNKTIMHSKQQ